VIGIFSLIKNERLWVYPWLKAWLPLVDAISLFDGNSTDGTLELIKHVQANHPMGHKIILRADADPKDFAEDYTRLFNECMWALPTDWAAFIHPDMIPVGDKFNLPDGGKSGMAALCHLQSFAGEPDGPLFEIKGRAEAWKNIYRLRNPNLGAHYFGAYGAHNEDVYFSEITGASHDFHGTAFNRYPYKVHDSGMGVLHFSDVRPLARRIQRMERCLVNQGQDPKKAATHPRVSFKSEGGFEFVPAQYPAQFLNDRAEGEKILTVKEPVSA
jgi:hypothetical protein